MERNASIPEPAIIGQDGQNEIHVQPVLQGGLRHVDIRLWRRAVSGFAPSHDGVTLDARDLAALHEGIDELLQASDGGRRVARVVRDSDDGRRLRAETEPFGTRYIARLGFWQRVRDSWKPVNDGLVIAAEQLRPLRGVLDRLRPWLQEAEKDGAPIVMPAGQESTVRATLDRWPAAGADWLTIEPDRVAFHPKGVRLTCTVSEQDNRHRLIIRQWKREDSLWLPEPPSIALSMSDLDNLLARLLRLRDALEGTLAEEPTGQSHLERLGYGEELRCTDGSSLTLAIVRGADGVALRMLYRPPQSETGLVSDEASLSVPAAYLPRLGRALAQGWFLLAGWLTEEERTALRSEQPQEEADQFGESRESVSDSSPSAPAASPSGGAAPGGDAGHPGHGVPGLPGTGVPHSPVESAPIDVAEEPQDGAGTSRRHTVPAAPEPLPVFSFGAESETPGTVIAGGGQIRVVVEGFLFPRNLTLPVAVVPQVITGLEELNALRAQQPRVNPVLLCDRPDCAVYGRIGTTMRPDAFELRVWTDPTTSDSVSFEAIYLPDLIDALRQALALLGSPMPSSSVAAEIPTVSPALLPQPSAPARMRPIAPTSPLEVPGPISPPGEPSMAPCHLSIPLGFVTLGGNQVTLTVQGHTEQPKLNLRWDSNSLEWPVSDLEEIVSDVRALYYAALRGRHGRPLSVGNYPIVTIKVEHHGTELCCVLQQEIDGEVTALSFPASEVPQFLNAALAALSRI
jgi:hypothetical protein